MDNWSKLYILANRISALEPWQFMFEEEIMGVRDPVSGTIGFISVMGHLGEHYSVTVYLGERALAQFRELSAAGPDGTPEMVLEIPQLMLSFEEKEFLEKEDRAVMKENGISYSGKKVYPMFRSYRPGMVPFFFEESEQESMVNFLEQFLEVAIRPESGKKGLKGKDAYLVRESVKEGKSIKWNDTFREIPLPGTQELQYPIDSELLARTKNIPVGKNTYEIDFFMTPAQVREKNKRPYFPYLLLTVDQRTELVIFNDLLNPSDGIEKMLVQIPGMLLKKFSQSTSLPIAVFAASPRLADLLLPLMKSLGIKLQYKPGLKSLEMAKSGIMDYFRRG
jgi:hypothetical protein